MRLTILTWTLILGTTLVAQELEKKETWVSGSARSILLTDTYNDDAEVDTTTANASMAGHTLLDLAANIKPTKNLFIFAEMRVRNDHGGFWGSGVTFDMRNLYLRGVVGNAFRYQIGDINYKLTEYTYFNDDEELSLHEQEAFTWMRDMNRYDLFFTDDNTWRTQGVTGEFGLQFKKGIETVHFDMFTSRLNIFGAGGFEKLYSGGRVHLKQSKHVDGHINYVHAFDLIGTSDSQDEYDNNVLSGGLGLHKDFGKWKADLNSEFGTSSELKIQAGDSLSNEDWFGDTRLTFTNESSRLTFELGYRNVGPQFRSIGAQTRRLNVGGLPRAFDRIGNEQNTRPLGMLDIIRDASLYNVFLSEDLMAFNPAYGNVSPYGRATPNRSIIDLGVDWKHQEDWVNASVDIGIGSEVIGSGTATLKDFLTTSAMVNFHIGEFLQDERQVDISIGFMDETTSRSGTESFENIDLQNTMIDLGLVVGIVDELKLVGGLKSLTSNGNEYERVTDEIGNIISFRPFRWEDRQESLTGVGLRYDFTETSMLTAQMTRYNAEGISNGVEPYSLNSFSIYYIIKF